MTTERDDSSMQRLLRSGVATVFLDVGEVGLHVSNIRVDYEKGIHDAVKHLLQLGHRRIAFIGGPEQFLSAELRRGGFTNAMKRHKPPVPTETTFCEGDFKLESGERAVRTLLALEHRPTAIIAANDLMAAGALGELKRAGLRVPADISLVGCDDIWLAAMTDPPLTTIHIPRAQIGRAAVEAVLVADAEGNSPGREIKIPTHLVVRQSTGPAAAAHA
jgi:LacI family transcriptional regulator